MAKRAIIGWSPSGRTDHWQPTTLDRVGKDEKFLEDALVQSPELLGLESRRTGIRGPFQIFQQVSMQTPSGRGICPDIVMLAASGHVIVVEVKRSVNPELRDRAVIAQIIDYASSFADLDEQQCIELFGAAEHSTWTDCIAALFPDDASAEELADVLFGRMASGELNLVIACDGIPPGLPDVVSGVAAQSALGFELDLVEVVPFVREVSESADILFVPSIRVSTEIVSRTAVTVVYRKGDAKPGAEVQTTSLEEIEDNLKAANRGVHPDAKTWTLDEIEKQFQQDGHPVTLRLLEFVKEHSADGKYTAPGKKLNAVFGFYVKGVDDRGRPKRLMIFNCVVSWNGIYLYLNNAASVVREATMKEFCGRLKAALGPDINLEAKEPLASHEAVAAHLEDFLQAMLWLKSQAQGEAAALD